MIATETVELMLIARTATEHGPVVDIFTAEGVVTGHAQGEWWESVPVQTATDTATLGEIDNAVTAAGYTRTSMWRGCITSHGLRWVADATTTIEPLGDTTE